MQSGANNSRIPLNYYAKFESKWNRRKLVEMYDCEKFEFENLFLGPDEETFQLLIVMHSSVVTMHPPSP